MQTKKFHLGDVLSVITHRIVSLRYMDGVRDILNFMTGDNLLTNQFPRAIDECKPYLVEQFPQLAIAEMDSAIVELGKALKAKSKKVEAEKVVADWLAKQVAKYGEMFAVKPIPTGAHKVKNPIAEVAKMMGGPGKVIVVRS